MVAARNAAIAPGDADTVLNGIVGAFIPEADKRGLAATFSAEYERLRAELEAPA